MLSTKKEENWELIAIYHDTEEALETCNWENVDLLLLDINMPGMNGLEMVESLREREWDTLVIIISGYAQFEYARKAMQNNAVDFITKPVATEKLFAALHKAQLILNKREIERKDRLLIAENIDRLIHEYFNEIIFGTQHFSDTQMQNLCAELGLGDKTYAVIVILAEESHPDFAGLLDAAKKTFHCSFTAIPQEWVGGDSRHPARSLQLRAGFLPRACKRIHSKYQVVRGRACKDNRRDKIRRTQSFSSRCAILGQQIQRTRGALLNKAPSSHR